MDSLPAHNPMKVLDRDPIVKADPGYVNICFASRSSSFALTFKVRKSHMFKDVKAAFGACTDQQPGGLVYTFKGQVVEDANTSEQVSHFPYHSPVRHLVTTAPAAPEERRHGRGRRRW